MKANFFHISCLCCMLSPSTWAASVSITINYDRANAFFQTADGTAIASGNLFIGTFDAVPTASSTAQEIEDAFHQLGLSKDINGTGSFAGTGEETDFEGKRIYLIASNNSDIGSASEIAVLSNSDLGRWVLPSELPSGSPLDTISLETDVAQSANRDMIFGSLGGTGDPGNGATWDVIRLEAVVVPEPSSFALLGLGATALLFRRRK